MRAAIFNILSERIARNLRKDFYESIINKDIAFFDANRTGDLGKSLNSQDTPSCQLTLCHVCVCPHVAVSRLNSDVQVI